MVKLHGDYKSQHLKNTAQELQTQDERLRRILVDGLARFGLVVVGYSGRDDSIMDALDEAVEREGALPAGLWWVARPGAAMLPRVSALLERASASGIKVNLVASETFDELAGDLEREVDLSDPLRQHVCAVRPRPLVEPVRLPRSEVTTFPVVRCSALEILDMPTRAREIALNKTLMTSEARRLIREGEVWATAAAYGNKLAVFGPDVDVTRVFSPVGARLNGTVGLNPAEHSIDRGLVYEAMVRAIVRRRPLRQRRGYTVVVRPPESSLPSDVAQRHQELLEELRCAYDGPLTGNVPRIDCAFAEGIRARIEEWDGRWWFVFEPYTWVDLPSDEVETSTDESAGHLGSARSEAPKLLAADWRRERWAQRYNRQWNDILAAWANLIAPEREAKLSTHHFRGPGINATFRVSSVTAWSSSAATQARGS